MIAITNPLDLTLVASLTESNLYLGQSVQLSGMSSNTTVAAASVPPNIPSGPSVDSTVQVIRANYDDLFRRLAD